MSPSHDNFENEEFELEELEGGFSSLSSLFNEREDLPVELEVDETIEIEESHQPVSDDIEIDDDIAPPKFSDAKNLPEKDSKAEEVAEANETDLEEDLEEDLGTSQDNDDIDPPAIAPSPSFGSLSDKEPGPQIGDRELTPFDSLSRDDQGASPEEVISGEYEESNQVIDEDTEAGTAEEKAAAEAAEAAVAAAEETAAAAEATKEHKGGFIGGIRLKMAEAKAAEAPAKETKGGFIGGIRSKMAEAKAAENPAKETKGGFIGGIRSKMAEAKAASSKAEDPSGDSLAGIDISKPKFSSEAAPSTSDFEKLLQPLSGAELSLLQMELQNEEPVFVQLKKAQNRSSIAQVVGLLFGLLVFALFAVIVGSRYFTVTLPGLALPAFVPLDGVILDWSYGDISGGILFGIGLILPLVGILAIAESVAVLWRAVSFGRILSLVEAIVAATVGIGIFICLLEAQIITAFILAVIWVIVRTTIKAIIKRSG